MPTPQRRRVLLLVLGLAALAGAGLAAVVLRLPGTNFSQYPGFAAHFAANPPSDRLPDAQQRALLERFRPRFMLSGGHPGPIGFYEDYVARGRLLDGDGRVIANTVSREVLNSHKDDPRAVFEHGPQDGAAPTPVVLARVDRASLAIGGRAHRLTFLTYHMVFRHSGLPAGLPPWLEWPARALADPRDWHQLDNYAAASVVLDEEGRPVALMLQQHNYLRTHLVGESMLWPADGRPRIDVAVRSNELYLHEPGRTRRRAVRFLEKGAFLYMLDAGSKPLLNGDDITDPAREADYELGFLPPSDAFYTFQGFLGERRRLPGRSGPPGAAYNTLPALKPLALQLLSGYWRPGNDGDIARAKKAITTSPDPAAFARAQAPVFAANLLCARRWGADCAFR